MSEEKSIEQMIYDETEKRLAVMESPDYVYPKTINKKDVIGIIAGIGISLVLILLCMIGVIK